MIWAMVLWNSWEARALFGDGAVYFIEIVRRHWPVHFYPARDYAMVAGQLPLLAALSLGVTDLHWLARALSIGMFALPIIFYHLALVRARDDAVLLAAVIMAIAIVFMTTSFSITDEFNTAYAVAVLAAVMLASNERPSVVDGLLLVALATFALRIYETFVAFGPLLAARSAWLAYRRPWLMAGTAGPRLLHAVSFAGLIVIVTVTSLIGRYAIFVPVGAALVGAMIWALLNASARPSVANGLYVLAAALFLASAAVAARSLLTSVESARYEEVLQSSQEVWWNIQFDLAAGTVLVGFIWALVFPQHLKTTKFYCLAGVGLVLLALSPLLALVDSELGPSPGSQSNARVVVGWVVLAMILAVWAYRSESDYRPKALVVLRDPIAGRRLATWALLMLAASVPADIVLTRDGSAFLETMRNAVRGRTGVIAFEDTPLTVRPFVFMYDDHSVSSLSLALRSRPTDCIVRPPRDYAGWVTVDPQNPPDLGRYFWRD